MDDWNFEDQTDQYNDGDTSTGNDYNGYTPGGDYSNIDTNYDTPVDYGNYGGNQFDSNTTPTTPDWFTSGDPNVTGSNAAPLNGMPTYNNTSANVGGDIKNYLSNLFSTGGAGAQGGLLAKGLAALVEGNQNKQRASAAQSMATNPALDPFGSQRAFYQQQAQQAVTNPYSSPIVQQQVSAMQHAQDIKDAAAGRRSNQLTSAPAVLAAQAKIAQDYQQQMATQGGAGIAPNQQLATILQNGSNAGINGYMSPLANAYGNASQTASNTNTLEALKKFLSGQA